jgi:hypothetical protein
MTEENAIATAQKLPPKATGTRRVEANAETNGLFIFMAVSQIIQ